MGVRRGRDGRAPPTTNSFLKGAWRPIAGWLGLLAIVAAGTMFTDSTPYPGFATFLPVLGTAAVLIAGAGAAPHVGAAFGVARVLGAAPLQLVGRLSYSLYLWHWPVLALGTALMPSLDLPGRLLLIGLSIVLAVASYVLVENPIRLNPYLAGRPALTVGLAALVTVTGLAATRRAEQSAIAEADSPAQRRITSAAGSVSHSLSDRHCVLDYRDERLRDCAFGEVGSPTTIVLFGDSHMAQWFSAYEDVARARGWRLEVLTKSACPPAHVDVVLSIMHRPYTECTEWRDAAFQRILALHPSVLILAAADGHVNSPNGGGTSRLTLREWQDGMRQTLRMMDSAGIRTVVLRDTPITGFDVPTCLSRALAHGRPFDGCGGARAALLREDVFGATRAATVGLAHVSTLDLSDHFCDATTCPPTRNGIVIYRDFGHITDAYAKSLAPYLLTP